MKRDMDLIRSLVLTLEGLDLRAGGVATLDAEKIAPAGISRAEVLYHWKLLVDAGWIDTGGRAPLNGLSFRALTWEGHDFADAVRDDAIWAMTKEGALKAKGFTIGLLGDLAKGFAKTQLAKHTGIEF